MNYREILDLIMKKKVDWNVVSEINCQAYEALKHSDSRTYTNLMTQLEDLAYSIDREHAEQIVHNMRPKGQMWTCEQVKGVMESRGVQGNPVDWYLVMNMVYNDYYNTAKIYGLHNNDEFYFNLAKDFIEDPDADRYKVAKYFTE